MIKIANVPELFGKLCRFLFLFFQFISHDTVTKKNIENVHITTDKTGLYYKNEIIIKRGDISLKYPQNNLLETIKIVLLL